MQVGNNIVVMPTYGICNQNYNYERFSIIEIVFEEPFLVIPKVAIGINRMDTLNEINFRINLNSVKESGFTVKITCWLPYKI